MIDRERACRCGVPAWWPPQGTVLRAFKIGRQVRFEESDVRAGSRRTAPLPSLLPGVARTLTAGGVVTDAPGEAADEYQAGCRRTGDATHAQSSTSRRDILRRVDQQGLRSRAGVAARRPLLPGPIDTFSDADSYLKAIQGLSQIVTGVDRHKVFVDGDDVCVIYDLKTAPVPNSPTAEWYHVHGGKVASIRVFFNARPFAPLFKSE